MDRWGPKHVELTYVMSKTQSLKNFMYLVGLHIYYKMIHGPYNINFINTHIAVFKILTVWDFDVRWVQSILYSPKPSEMGLWSTQLPPIGTGSLPLE